MISANMTAGSTTGKVIVIAGDGGTSYSAKPQTTGKSKPTAEQIAMAVGAVNGPGGAGGGIANFVQPTTTNTHVDLIAGNGGATVGHSVAAQNATVDNSGKGGSITNANITGSIGNSDPTVAIKSYNNILGGQSVQDFVDSYILGDISAPIDDSVGNVGLVAGAAGRVEGGLPSSDGISGSVTNVHAENIMSMVAGNVEQVDLIQRLTDYGVTITGGILGAPKSVFYDPATMQVQPYVVFGTPLVAGPLNYVSATGLQTNTPLPGGGILIDGAFVAKNIRTILSPRDFEGTQA